MGSVFVKAENASGRPIVASLYNFAFLPRVGERLLIDEGSKSYLLEVKNVQHFHRPTDEKYAPSEDAHLECALIETWEE